MIEYILAVIVLAVVILLVSGSGKQRYRGPHTSDGQTMLYSHDSRDVAGEVYFPTFKDSTAPFPLGKREEREKTETYQNRR